jgi:hypothetical protein
VNPWFRDRAARGFIVRRYLPWFVGLSLVWETAQLPLYTLWREASPGQLAFAVAHCTVGDIIITCASLGLALTLGREGPLASWHWRKIISLMLLFGTGYTVLSESLNTTILFRWSYSDLMPVLKAGGVQVGLSPLAQWIVAPLLALRFAQPGFSRRLQRFRATPDQTSSTTPKGHAPWRKP